MRYLFTFILFIILGSSVFAQAVEETQRTLITKRTASWCSNCGTWGWDFMESLIDDNEEKAVLIAAHYSGDLVTDYAIDMTNNFGGIGQPNFFVGNERLPAGSSSWPSLRTDTKSFVDMNFERAPLANTGLAADFIGEDLIINTNTKFFEDADGEYSVSVFILENGIVNPQSGQGASAVHKKVLIASATGDTFGETVVSGAVTAGTEIAKTYTVAGLDANLKDNYEVVAIIWNLNTGFRNFVNTFSITGNEFGNTVSVDNSIDPSVYKVFPSISSDVVNINLVQNDAQNAIVSIFDLNGKLLKTIYRGTFSADLNLQVSKSALGIANGTYLIHLDIDGKIATEKVIFNN